jgi:putative transcriptional regulator
VGTAEQQERNELFQQFHAEPDRQARLTCSAVTSTLVTMKSTVRSLRTAAGLSQSALAAELGVSRQTINAIETGRYDPSLGLAARLSRYFGQSIEEIFDVSEH